MLAKKVLLSLGVLAVWAGCVGGSANSRPALKNAPGGRVAASDGQAVELSDFWKNRPVVVVFYRGHW